MKVKRKIIQNQDHIDEIRHHNSELLANYAGQPNVPQLKLPRPIYGTYIWNFKIHQLNSFYIERTIIDKNGTETEVPEGEGDIIAGILYEGTVRLEYDPLVVSKFELALHGE